MEETIHFNLNGKPVEVTTDSDRMLLWVLRSNLELTGAKYGCGEGYCAACTVCIDNIAVRSCQTPLKDVRGKHVLTIEGLAKGEMTHPLQKAFMEHDALQCGYCTSGMIMSAYALLKNHSHPSPSEIIKEMDDNLCRCGAHKRIVEAIQTASKEIEGGY